MVNSVWEKWQETNLNSNDDGLTVEVNIKLKRVQKWQLQLVVSLLV